MPTPYNIIIIGGGIVGLTLACALGKSHLNVAVVDARAPLIEWPGADYDMRVSAITPASQAIFSVLNIWPRVVAHRVSPFTKMHVWDAEGEGVIDFEASTIEAINLGYIVENRALQVALYEQLQTFTNVHFIAPADLQTLQVQDAVVKVVLTDGNILATKLVVGADGAESRVRQLAGIALHSSDYGHSALVANVQCELAHQKTAWQRFIPKGVLAFLPLVAARTCSIVWSAEPADVECLAALDAAEFCRVLGEAFAHRLGTITHVSERAIFPLWRRHAQQYVAPRIALVGDAAHTVHPLAGQGVNLGILDAASLAEIILAAHTKSQDFGMLNVLRRYERWRKGENLIMLNMIDTLKYLFGNDKTFIKAVRTLGINSVNKIGPLKNYLMQRAMGWTGDLPAIARRHA